MEDMEGAVKAALIFIGNASSQCTTLRRTGILEEYNKDLVSFSQESGELFCFCDQHAVWTIIPGESSQSTSSSSKLCDKLVAVAPISLTRFSQRPLRATHSGGASPIPFKEEAVNLITEEEQEAGVPQ